MKRQNMEFLLGWLDALRRGDDDAVLDAIEPSAVWQAVDPEFSCHSATEIRDTFIAARNVPVEIDSLEMIGAPRHVILHVRWPEVLESDADFLDGIYNVFEIEASRIIRIDDFAERAEALAAAGLPAD